MRHFGLTLYLKDDPEIIRRYEEYHRNIWKEVPENLKAEGITKMNLYRMGRQLFMAMETTDDFDIDGWFPRYLARDPKCVEWDTLMRAMQEKVPGAGEDEWWAMMPCVYEL